MVWCLVLFPGANSAQSAYYAFTHFTSRLALCSMSLNETANRKVIFQLRNFYLVSCCCKGLFRVGKCCWWVLVVAPYLIPKHWNIVMATILRLPHMDIVLTEAEIGKGFRESTWHFFLLSSFTHYLVCIAIFPKGWQTILL